MALIPNQDSLEQAADRLKERQRAQRRESLSFYGMSQIAARVLLLAAGLLWLRAYLVYIDPLADLAAGVTLRSALDFAIDSLLAIVFAAGQALIPPLCISVLVTNSPAQMVLTRLNLKISWIWYAFAIMTGVFLSFQSANLVYSYWLSRPLFADGSVSPIPFTIMSMLLLIGFPAWAINQLTASQWVDSMLLSRAALAIKHAIDIEDMAAKALLVRTRGLLFLDVAELTLEQRAANNAEVAGILAGAAKMFKVGLLQVAESQKALSGYQAQLGLDDDQTLVDKMTRVARLLTDTKDQVAFTQDFAASLAQGQALAPAAERAPGPLTLSTPSAAEVVRLAGNDAPEIGPTARAELAGPGLPFEEALAAIHTARGGELWMRRDVEKICNVQKTKASEMIGAWKTKGLIEEVENPQYHYRITAMRRQ